MEKLTGFKAVWVESLRRTKVFFELFAELILGLRPHQTKQLWSSKMPEDTSERLAHLWMEKEEQIQKTEEL